MPIRKRVLRYRYSVGEPNFSIVLPGGCNAKCAFCFEGARPEKKLSVERYIEELEETLLNLPRIFTSISITGGEPTISKYFIPVLQLLASVRIKKRFKKVVLTTNGTNFEETKAFIYKAVKHINLSRHHYDDDKNQQIFKGKYKLTSQDHIKMVWDCSKHGIDVTANCVFNEKTNSKFFNEYTAYARAIGFSAIHFRKENGDLEVPSNWKKAFKGHVVVGKGGCPVCETTWILNRGMRVALKTSVLEPDTVLEYGKLHELIFLADGKIYTDWAGKHAVELAEFDGEIVVCDIKAVRKVTASKKIIKIKRKAAVRESSFGGCGTRCSNSCGGGGYSSEEEGGCGAFGGNCR